MNELIRKANTIGILYLTVSVSYLYNLIPNNSDSLNALLGLISFICSLIGIKMATQYRKVAEGWLETHYHYLVRTFWIGCAYISLQQSIALVGIIYGTGPLFDLLPQVANGSMSLGDAEKMANQVTIPQPLTIINYILYIGIFIFNTGRPLKSLYLIKKEQEIKNPATWLI